MGKNQKKAAHKVRCFFLIFSHLSEAHPFPERSIYSSGAQIKCEVEGAVPFRGATSPRTLNQELRTKNQELSSNSPPQPNVSHSTEYGAVDEGGVEVL
jgi:hypothetical protein